ncbi:MAG: HD domain-containing protein [Oscillospiraceae bacterium]
MYKAIFSHKSISDVPDYFDCVSDLLRSDAVQQLGEFRHHKGTTRLQHSLNVSYYNYLICRRFHWDARSAARAGLLHDLFLYDRKEHERVEGEGWHGVGHPKIAFFNAVEMFPLNERESDMIINHMFPITPHLPRYRETWVIQLVDKFCAMCEFGALAASSGRKYLRLAGTFSLTLLVRLTLHM